MSAIESNIDNKNFLSPLNFRFQIKKCPNVNFFLQNVNLPGMTLVGPDQPNPFVKIPKAGDHIDFDDLMINYKVDEDLQNYIELYTWIRELGFPNDFNEYKSIASNPVYTGLGVISDISLIILSSSRNPTHEVVFKDAFPISISSLIFDSTSTDVQFLEASATFKYRSYAIQNI